MDSRAEAKTSHTPASLSETEKKIREQQIEADLIFAGQPNDKRLWVGNLDSRVTEGYAFITYEDRSSAIKARQTLDGKKLYSRPILVKSANRVCKEDLIDEKGKVDIPALRGAKSDKSQASIDSKIYAIEAKLKSLEQAQQGGAGSTVAFGISPLSRLASVNQPKPTTSRGRSNGSQGSRRGPYTRPYSKI